MTQKIKGLILILGTCFVLQSVPVWTAERAGAPGPDTSGKSRIQHDDSRHGDRKKKRAVKRTKPRAPRERITADQAVAFPSDI